MSINENIQVKDQKSKKLEINVKQVKIDYKLNLNEFYEIVFQQIKSDDIEIKLNGLTKMRISVSGEDREKGIGHIVNEPGMVSKLIQFLLIDEYEIAIETCWIITNIASGSTSDCKCLVDNGAINRLVGLLGMDKPPLSTIPPLSSTSCNKTDIMKNQELKDQVLWALANISANDLISRDLVLESGALKHVLSFQIDCWEEGKYGLSFLKNLSWLLFNLCRHPKPPFHTVSPLLNIFNALLKYSNDDEIILNVCRSISATFSDVTEGIVHQILMEYPIFLEKTIEFLYWKDSSTLQTTSLRFIGNLIFNGDNISTQFILDTYKGLVKYLGRLLSNEKKSFRKESAWIISNLAVGPNNHIQLLIDHGVIHKIINILNNDEPEVRNECIWSIHNLIRGASQNQMFQLFHSSNLVYQLSQLLNGIGFSDRELSAILNCISIVLNNGPTSDFSINPMVLILMESNFLNNFNNFVRNYKHNLVSFVGSSIFVIINEHFSDFLDLIKKFNYLSDYILDDFSEY